MVFLKSHYHFHVFVDKKETDLKIQGFYVVKRTETWIKMTDEAKNKKRWQEWELWHIYSIGFCSHYKLL